MPLIIRKEISPAQTLGIWQISEEPSSLLSMLGCRPAGFDRYQQLQHESRRQQWLASRVLLRLLTNDSLAEIIYDAHSKPYIKDSSLKISISHSYGLVAVIIDREKETGIDIEIIKPKIERIASKFMSNDELQYIDQAHRIEALYVHWCAKEALYKLYGKKELIFRENLLVEPFEYKQEGHIAASIRAADHSESYMLRYEKTGGHMLVYVVNNSNIAV
jgi:4'-phosphopantetheinyl transferase